MWEKFNLAGTETKQFFFFGAFFSGVCDVSIVSIDHRILMYVPFNCFCPVWSLMSDKHHKLTSGSLHPVLNFLPFAFFAIANGKKSVKKKKNGKNNYMTLTRTHTHKNN